MLMTDDKTVVDKMKRPLYISFDNGEVYVVDGHFVAENAAKFYASNYPEYPNSSYEENYKYEYEWMLSDTDLMVDHMQNKMDWEELESVYLGKYKYDYHDNFINAVIDDIIEYEYLEEWEF